MDRLSDQQLLRDYAERRSEPAFAELVRRHVDLVYSAALRMVCDAHLAEDVAQGAFLALAQNAGQLTGRPALTGWLHRTAQNLAANVVRSDVRRRAREQEAAAMNELLSPEPDAVWEKITPHLDAALENLNELDRDALLLRYFERKSAHEIAQTFGISDDAAQKRVSRAVERLREFFSKRGVAIGASGLVVLISANAVQSAPLALATTISTATVLAGTTAHAAPTIAAIKTITMTTLQKAALTLALAAAIGTAIFEAHQVSQLRAQLQMLQQANTSLTAQFREIQEQQNGMDSTLASLRNENELLKSNTTAAKPRTETPDENRDFAKSESTNAPVTNPLETSAPSTNGIRLPIASWTNAGFATPEDNLKTRGWAILNGDREQFKDSIFLTDGARKIIEDMILKMGAASADPEKLAALQEAVNNKWGAEEAILMPLMALNKDKGFTGFNILSEQSPSDDERILQVETQMASAPAQKETLKFQRFGNDWKVVIDENFVNSAH
jgi:RNA polymerase sigma factor (sigma-70 family)